MPEAMVNGVRIWYQETGAGAPVVQIHGAGFGHFNFATATPILSQRVFAALISICAATASLNDLSNVMTWKFRADDVAGLMDHLGLRSAHIHGTSMGGMVAQQFAAKYPGTHSAARHQLLGGEARLRRHPTFRGWIDIAERFGIGVPYLGRADRAAGTFPPLSGHL